MKDVLATVNFGDNAIERLTSIATTQKRPLYAAEYWSGWFTLWGDKHMSRHTVSKFAQNYEDILFRMNSSVNIYMFEGGTNFGFMNGASALQKNGHSHSVVTSYDYDAPLTEAGQTLF
jgi:hypothetical protein